jgi:hypothetical protein
VQTNTNLTLYSRSISGGLESWTRSVIRDVQWENTKAANLIASGLQSANAVDVYIPTHNRTTTITIKPGDVIVEGIVTDEIDTEYTISNLKADNADVVVVKTVDRYDFGSSPLRHIRVGGS